MTRSMAWVVTSTRKEVDHCGIIMDCMRNDALNRVREMQGRELLCGQHEEPHLGEIAQSPGDIQSMDRFTVEDKKPERPIAARSCHDLHCVSGLRLSRSCMERMSSGVGLSLAQIDGSGPNRGQQSRSGVIRVVTCERRTRRAPASRQARAVH